MKRFWQHPKLKKFQSLDSRAEFANLTVEGQSHSGVKATGLCKNPIQTSPKIEREKIPEWGNMKFCQRTTFAPKASACDTVGLFETAICAEASGQDAGLPASFVTFLSGKEKFEKPFPLPKEKIYKNSCLCKKKSKFFKNFFEKVPPLNKNLPPSIGKDLI